MEIIFQYVSIDVNICSNFSAALVFILSFSSFQNDNKLATIQMDDLKMQDFALGFLMCALVSFIGDNICVLCTSRRKSW